MTDRANPRFLSFMRQVLNRALPFEMCSLVVGLQALPGSYADWAGCVKAAIESEKMLAHVRKNRGRNYCVYASEQPET